MKILLTGSFGNIGLHALEELLRRSHAVTCFDLPTVENRKLARAYGDRAQIHWGDLCRPTDLAGAVEGQEVVIHLAFVIPRISATGMSIDAHPEWAREVNVGGTQNLLLAMKSAPIPPRIIFASSLHVYGQTQDRPTPRTVLEELQPIEPYSHHKVACEAIVKDSGLVWSIFRLPVTLPIRLIVDPGIFEVPLANRLEFAHGRDVGSAFAAGVECPEIWGKTLLIGGGPACQYTYREVVSKILNSVGIGMLPEKAFSSIPYPVDWLETRESQRLLHYQQRTLDDYTQDLQRLLGFRRYLVAGFRPWIRLWLLKQSPYYHRPDWKAQSTAAPAR